MYILPNESGQLCLFLPVFYHFLTVSSSSFYIHAIWATIVHCYVDLELSNFHLVWDFYIMKESFYFILFYYSFAAKPGLTGLSPGSPFVICHRLNMLLTKKPESSFLEDLFITFLYKFFSVWWLNLNHRYMWSLIENIGCFLRGNSSIPRREFSWTSMKCYW